MKNGKPIASGGRYNMTDAGCEHTLVIENAELGDEANYTAVIAEESSTAKAFVQGTLHDASPFKHGVSNFVFFVNRKLYKNYVYNNATNLYL